MGMASASVQKHVPDVSVMLFCHILTKELLIGCVAQQESFSYESDVAGFHVWAAQDQYVLTVSSPHFAERNIGPDTRGMGLHTAGHKTRLILQPDLAM